MNKADQCQVSALQQIIECCSNKVLESVKKHDARVYLFQHDVLGDFIGIDYTASYCTDVECYMREAQDFWLDMAYKITTELKNNEVN